MLGQELIRNIKRSQEFIDKSGAKLEEDIKSFLRSRSASLGDVRLFFNDQQNELTTVIKARWIGLFIKKYKILPENDYSDNYLIKLIDDALVYLTINKCLLKRKSESEGEAEAKDQTKNEPIIVTVLPYAIRFRPEFVYHFFEIDEQAKKAAKPGEYFFYQEINLEEEGSYVSVAIKLKEAKVGNALYIRENFYILKLKVGVKDNVFTYGGFAKIEDAVEKYKNRLIKLGMLPKGTQLKPLQMSTGNSDTEDGLDKENGESNVNNNNYSSHTTPQIYTNTNISVPKQVTDLKEYWGELEIEKAKEILDKAKLGYYLLCVTDLSVEKNKIDKNLVLFAKTNKGVYPYQINFTNFDHFTLYAVDTTDISKVIEVLFVRDIKADIPENIPALIPFYKQKENQKDIVQFFKPETLDAVNERIFMPTKIADREEYCLGGYKEAKDIANKQANDFKVGNYLLFQSENTGNRQQPNNIIMLTFLIKINDGQLKRYTINIRRDGTVYSFFKKPSFEQAVEAVEERLKKIEKVLNMEDKLVPWRQAKSLEKKPEINELEPPAKKAKQDPVAASSPSPQ